MITHSHETCADFPNIFPASEKDNEEILAFLQTVSMTLKDGSLDFSRGPNFFALNKLQGIASQTFIFRNPDNKLVGIGVITSVRGNYHGKEMIWAYTSELRFSPEMHKRVRAQFRPWYALFLQNSKQLNDLHNPEFILSIVLDDNEIAKQSLLNRKNPVVYRPVHQYQTRAIIGKIPTLKKSTSFVTRASANDKCELINLFKKAQETNAFSYSIGDIEDKLKTLGHTWNDFLIARDLSNNVLGAVLVTSDNEFRMPYLKFEKGSKLKNISFLLKALGRPQISSDAKIQTSMLAFMTFSNELSPAEKEAVTSDFIRKAWKKDQHALIFREDLNPNFENHFLKYGLLSQKIPATVYQIIHKSDYRKQNLLRGIHRKGMQLETSFL